MDLNRGLTENAKMKCQWCRRRQKHSVEMKPVKNVKESVVPKEISSPSDDTFGMIVNTFTLLRPTDQRVSQFAQDLFDSDILVHHESTVIEYQSHLWEEVTADEILEQYPTECINGVSQQMEKLFDIKSDEFEYGLVPMITYKVDVRTIDSVYNSLLEMWETQNSIVIWGIEHAIRFIPFIVYEPELINYISIGALAVRFTKEPDGNISPVNIKKIQIGAGTGLAPVVKPFGIGTGKKY